ncbi:acetyl-CoA acetyltransferase [Paenibacillus hamazuiensis]|uniref:acetyl-CoA acetyltransferase n=1 Tax=Paenibacillus hamazuiensis TaxID=2936508 RepID=UPI00200C90E5|nr:acetyl-CoA acetyltransferase [Paenibacillus hamazuiensis]
MMNNPYAAAAVNEGLPGYQADASVVPVLRKLRDEAHEYCKKYTHRRVRIRTISGQTYEGVIAGVDRQHVYLLIAHGQGYAHTSYPSRPIYPPFFYNNLILPLVLYELLVISLLY